MNDFQIPEAMRDGLKRYIEHGVPMGSFGTALLENNLRNAVSSADLFNRHRLPEFVDWLYWSVPGDAWGSHEKVVTWIKAGGTVGINAARMRSEDEGGKQITSVKDAAAYWKAQENKEEPA